uniref:NH(3)-dependent NAD(+) synthetase n=1 Tax=Lygus hesperus TaxID=30085 RepID=A0A0A9YFL2_LYGHE
MRRKANHRKQATSESEVAKKDACKLQNSTCSSLSEGIGSGACTSSLNQSTDDDIFTTIATNIAKGMNMDADQLQEIAKRIKLEHVGQILALSSERRTELESILQTALQVRPCDDGGSE